MTRRLLGLLVALCLTSACKDAPVGQMEPIPRPAGEPATPPPEAAAPKPTPEPAPDPSKVTLRWKLTTPIAFRLTTTGTESGPAADEDAKGKKGKPQAAGPRELNTSALFVLHKTETGDPAFRFVPEGAGAAVADEGSMSERGFVLDGLPPALRNTAVLVLELPRDPVGPNATWALGTNLVDVSSMTNFTQKKAERRNQVKLTALTPGEGGEQVATLEYDLPENISGDVRGPRAEAPKAAATPKKPVGKKSAEEVMAEEMESAEAAPTSEFSFVPASASVQMKGKGEFLVKAGRWRSWEGTVTTTAEGAALSGVMPGERTLRLTPVDPVPPEHLPSAKK